GQPPFPAGANPQLPDFKRFAFAVGTNGGANPHVIVFADEKGTIAYSFFAYEKTFDGGVRVDMADLNGDGVPELIVAPGPSKGNGFIAAADFANNGQAHPVVGLDAGAVPLVRVFDPKGKPVAERLAYDEKFRGGVRVAVGSRNHIVTAPGPGLKNSPVRIFDV